MSPRAGLENLDPTGIRSPDRPARSSVAVPTELPGPFRVVDPFINTNTSAHYGNFFITSVTTIHIFTAV